MPIVLFPKKDKPQLVRGFSPKVVRLNVRIDEDVEEASLANISRSGLLALSNDVSTNNHVTKLDFRHVCFGPEEAVILAKGLSTNRVILDLNLQHNNLSDAGVGAVADALTQQGVLEVLTLDANGIGDTGAAAIAEFVSSSRTLKELRLFDNHILKDGGAAIGSAVEKCPTLRHLDLGLNEIGDPGAVALAKALCNHSRVSKLSVRANGITSIGGKAIAKALRKNCRLRSLDIRVNRMRDDAVKHLFEALLTNTHLQELDCSGNNIRDDAMEFVAEVILQNKFITKLSFEDNYFTDEAAEVFLKLLQKAEHLSMTEFGIHNNYISEIKLQQIDLFMRTHARELQKKKRENKRQRSQSIQQGEATREESKMSAGRQSSGSLSRSTSRLSARGSREVFAAMHLTPQPKAWHARLHGSLREGVYFAEVLLGSPRPQRASLIVDTASWVTELTCTGCSACGKHLHPHFNLSGSATGDWIRCGPNCPGKCQKDQCSFQEKYLEGSSLQGRWFRDSLRFVSANGSTEPLTASVGCALKESGLFHAQQQNGILGLAPGSATKPTMIWQAFKKAPGSKRRKRVFSLSLGGEGGELVIGADTAHVGHWVPLQISGSSGKYGVKVEALMFNGRSIPCRGRAQLDSASTFTYLPKEAETQLRSALADFCKGQQCVPADPPAATGDEARRHCWHVQGGADISTKRFPVLSWRLQGVEVPWPPSRYLVRYSGKRARLCYTFRATNALPDGSQVVLGASWMVGQELLFDIDRSRLGLTKANARANGSEPSELHRDSPHRRRVVPRDAPSSRSVEQPVPITTIRTDLTTALPDSPAETSSSGGLPLPDPVLGFELETQIVEGAAGLLLLGAFVLRARRKLWRLLFNCLQGERG
ncbi:Protein NLRC3 [Symbiodinium microadriaticum]|uniref:Protein NLRC3 n=1 Tax=Symbiodinium microadriaticum TaxID=2951 RepID=A0A1Q9CLM5_SYMMI|nr:Protein NLRC3 [Symbiodinium microadriaticum]CAE7908189.1 NLRC3 [Symbiodinium microadriaticum]